MDGQIVAPVARRRGLLSRGLLAAAGAVGWSLLAGRRASANEHEPAPETVVASSGASVLRLHGRAWHLQTAHRKRGELPVVGDRLGMYGELLDAPDGSKVGEFYAAGIFFDAPFGQSELSAANLEQHTFRLSDGTIVGLGTASGDEGVYAVVGGTGRYAGARGSYVARLQPIELGGDGSAEFTLSLIA